MMSKIIVFQVIRISDVATGVGITEFVDGCEYSEKICDTLFDTGDDEKDAVNSEKWARIIVKALNRYYHQ